MCVTVKVFVLCNILCSFPMDSRVGGATTQAEPLAISLLSQLEHTPTE